MNGLLTSYLTSHYKVLVFNKSKYYNSDTTIAFIGRKYVSMQIFSSIRSFVGILTLFERHFGLFYDPGCHIWRQNVILPLQKVKMSKFWHHNRFSIQKNSPTRILRQQSHLIEISGVLVIFGPFWVVLGVHDVTKGVKIL